jgi:hypothetical protein
MCRSFAVKFILFCTSHNGDSTAFDHACTVLPWGDTAVVVVDGMVVVAMYRFLSSCSSLGRSQSLNGQPNDDGVMRW